jgi:hypothetical protein
MPKGKYEHKRNNHDCNHEFVLLQNSQNYYCIHCTERYSWSIETEKIFLDSMACNDSKPPHKRILALKGYISAVSRFPSGNFTPSEDMELMKYAAKLLIAIEASA